MGRTTPTCVCFVWSQFSILNHQLSKKPRDFKNKCRGSASLNTWRTVQPTGSRGWPPGRPLVGGSASCMCRGQVFADGAGLSMPVAWSGRRVTTGPLAEGTQKNETKTRQRPARHKGMWPGALSPSDPGCELPRPARRRGCWSPALKTHSTLQQGGGCPTDQVH